MTKQLNIRFAGSNPEGDVAMQLPARLIIDYPDELRDELIKAFGRNSYKTDDMEVVEVNKQDEDPSSPPQYRVSMCKERLELPDQLPCFIDIADHYGIDAVFEKLEAAGLELNNKHGAKTQLKRAIDLMEQFREVGREKLVAMAV